MAETLRKLRNYGQRLRYDHELAGYNSRLDELHAAVLREKLKHLERWTQRRIAIAATYDQSLANKPIWKLPSVSDASRCVYHLYPIQVDRRDETLQSLKAAAIESLVHYPALIPEQECYRTTQKALASEKWPIAYAASRRLLSLPINPYVMDQEVKQVISTLAQALS
jgi:dTDP-3-amino-3,4,6-trideoxy-alpha-D-glucose transaminase